MEILAIEALHAAQLLDPAGRPATALVPVLHALVTANLPAAALVDQAADLLTR